MSAPRATGSSTVSFGLVNIPVKIYSTGDSKAAVRFNLLHPECGARVKQQYACSTCDAQVSRAELARGYEFAKGEYVTLSDDEYQALQCAAGESIDIAEFIPTAQIDVAFIVKSYHLAPERGAERAYKLLVGALEATGRCALARHSASGKQRLVAIWPNGEGGLSMTQLKYADETRAFADIHIADAPDATDAELALAMQIIDELSSETFAPDKYRDEVKERMLKLIDDKIKGKEITVPEAPQAQVIDLMAALKASVKKTPKRRKSSRKKRTKKASR